MVTIAELIFWFVALAFLVGFVIAILRAERKADELLLDRYTDDFNKDTWEE